MKCHRCGKEIILGQYHCKGCGGFALALHVAQPFEEKLDRKPEATLLEPGDLIRYRDGIAFATGAPVATVERIERGVGPFGDLIWLAHGKCVFAVEVERCDS